MGFHVIDLLAKVNNIKLRKDKILPALTGKGRISGEEILFLKPNTYMNRSGIAVKGLLDLYGLSPQRILVILDDIDLPWNKIRIRKHGSSGGHKGTESIIAELNTTNFPRLRMGIGRDFDLNKDVISHVLGNFNSEEKKELKNYCMRAVDAVYTILNSGIDTAMNNFN